MPSASEAWNGPWRARRPGPTPVSASPPYPLPVRSFDGASPPLSPLTIGPWHQRVPLHVEHWRTMGVGWNQGRDGLHSRFDAAPASTPRRDAGTEQRLVNNLAGCQRYPSNHVHSPVCSVHVHSTVQHHYLYMVGHTAAFPWRVGRDAERPDSLSCRNNVSCRGAVR